MTDGGAGTSRGRRVRYALYAAALAALFALGVEGAARLLVRWGAVDTRLIVTMGVTPPGWEMYGDDPDAIQGVARLAIDLKTMFVVDRAAGVLRVVPRLGYVRAQTIPLAREAGEFRVLFLGGSSVVGHGLEVEESFPVQAAEQLRARMPGRRVTVLNAGMDAGSTTDAREVLGLVAGVFSPDLVICYSGHNELIPIQLRNLPEFNNVGMRPLLRRAYLTSDALKVSAYLYFARFPAHTERLYEQFRRWHASVNYAGWDDWEKARKNLAVRYGENLEAIARDAQGVGARCLLASVASNVCLRPTVSLHGPGFNPADEQAYAEGLTRTHDLYESGELDQALATAQEQIAADPFYAEAHFYEGLIRKQLGQRAEAVRCLRAARDATPVHHGMSIAPTFFADIAADAARRSGAAFLNTEDGLLADDGYWRDPARMFTDEIHPSPEGNRLVASLIVARVEGLGWVPPTGD